ncbi:sigma 54-interacting transcriptional regulator [Intestinirhabdus alba]|jgi:propionate catabolism operon transcriptional regulator|uniref:AAA domain-containing protein n=1 Tax=Intestinirhabdus alba TaxID=2899544 RepID=A0A6L6IF24_9ENTR|nr:sigma 54-interacting transcriptional regulator [Intestinirhabdus alba]MTH45442.1 AAA domain-containing protein [Intestinirhabdus alba]
MKSNEIVIFSVSRTITQRIANVLIERQLEIPVYEFHYSEVLDKASEMITSGSKIIISRGGTAALLRSNLTIPVIEIAHDFHGVYRILQEAKNRSQKIAAVGFPSFCNALRHYQNMTNEDFKICQVYNHYDIESVVKSLSESHYQLVIGGLTVAEMAKKYRLNAVMGDTDTISIEQAINEAFSLLKYINQQHTRATISHAALNQAREGIMCVDHLGQVLTINAAGSRLFQCHVGDKIVTKEAFREIYASIINEQDLQAQPVEINGSLIYISVKNFTHRQACWSIVTGVAQDSALWQSVGNKKGRLRGFTTRYTFADIIGRSEAISATIARARLYAGNALPVTILGETGTGKELFAQSIHHHGDRSQRPFIAINCAAIPENILESELFGYADGAFTGARKGGKPGVFEMAMGGSVFIDEISEAPLSVQIKLLRVLQEQQFTRLGGDALLTADFRLITASNKDLSALVKSGAFRQDLYYRINVLELKLPALRERAADIPLIVQHLLSRQGKTLVFVPDALEALSRHAWPGNVRELQAVVWRLAALLEAGMVDKALLQQIAGIASVSEEGAPPAADANISSDETMLLKKQEKRLIAQVLDKTHGDRTKASIMLGISPTTLWRKLKEHRISG